jgi:hypothetical protein
MKPSPNEHLRDDLEAQFEFDGMPPLSTNRPKDFKAPCDECEIAACPCTGWLAFPETTSTERG